MSHSIHSVPGRLRVRSNAFRCSSSEAQSVQRRLISMDGVTQVRLNAHAGSITVHYDSERLTKQTLLDVMKTLGCTQAMPRTNPAVASKAGAMFGKALIGAVINKAMERSALKLVSVLL
ncbi:HMA2 domain-containing protein [Thiocystis violascens]|uniref:Copper chaperone n=1 Tax=Thiocystis violascens (strain ATCC 17096 / DSM 198 / 6111) TaxID=765911 RepID=I3Y8J1_THIV6|nr:hypothetical protein [Thiocystis violascens]AFL73309.1 hypothetical protein Thivi_1288 [Thiocystis violascens DSM 198]